MLRAFVISWSSAVLCHGLSVLASNPDWPQWRGVGGSGVSRETNVLLEWNTREGILWRSPLPGRGHSSPVVVNGRVFLTTDVEGEVVPGAKAVEHSLRGEPFKHPDSTGADRSHELRVLCLEAASGKLLWSKVAYSGTVFDDRHRKGSYASPTVAADRDRVFAFFGGEGLYCYDFEGALVWSNRFGGLALLGLGPGSSPVLSGRAVIAQCDQNEGEHSFIAAFDKRTGKELWRAARQVSASWATPVVVKWRGREQVIASGMETIIAYDAETGSEVWRHEGLGNNAVPSPVAGPDAVYLAAGYPRKRTLALSLAGRGDVTGTTSLLWEYDRGAGYVPSPLLAGGDFYLMTDGGALSCLDARSGEVRYDGERLPSPARFTASPVAVAGHLLLTSEKGDTFVVKAGAKHEFVRKNPVGESVFASLAVAENRIYIRGETHLICIGR